MGKRKPKGSKSSRPAARSTAATASGVRIPEKVRKLGLASIFVVLLAASTSWLIRLRPSRVAEIVSNSKEELRRPSETSPPPFQSMWQMTSWYSRRYDSRGLQSRLRRMFQTSERAFDPRQRATPPTSTKKSPGAGVDRTTRHKLLHDLEQFDFYLRQKEFLKMKDHAVELFRNELPRIYGATLRRLEEASKNGILDEETEFYNFREPDREIQKYYNRAMFLPEFGPGDSEPLLSPRDWSRVEKQWFGEEKGGDHSHPGVVVLDDLLSPSTLQRVRDYLLFSTFWYEAKLPRYGRYVGAYLGDGMHDTLLLEIAYDLHRAMPRVMKDHALKELWSYKYESSDDERHEDHRTGIHVHADDAMVNVNRWITPDEANLDRTSGGLVVYTIKPPTELVGSFQDFNSNWEYVEQRLLRPNGYANVTVPYKQNRAVIFDPFFFTRRTSISFGRGTRIVGLI